MVTAVRKKKKTAKTRRKTAQKRTRLAGKPRKRSPASIGWLTTLHPAELALDPNWVAQVCAAAAASRIARYSWNDRGLAKIGYTKGMAVVFGVMYSRLKGSDPVVLEMAKPAGHPDRDALRWYESIFRALGMANNVAGADTLRHLFVLLMGLGMRESSGKYCEGRDRSANNITGEKAEAGLFQTSFNARSAHPFLPQIFSRYSANPVGYREIFQERVTCRPQDWENFGAGPGVAFQELSKTCPAFAVEFAAVGVRNLRAHWGPINNHHVEIKPDCDALFLEVQAIIDRVTFGRELV